MTSLTVSYWSSCAQVSAIDRDIGANGQVLYRLVEDGEERFTIEETTGQISVNNQLSFDDQNREFTLIVEASDKGVYPRKLKIYILFTHSVVKGYCWWFLWYPIAMILCVAYGCFVMMVNVWFATYALRIIMVANMFTHITIFGKSWCIKCQVLTFNDEGTWSTASPRVESNLHIMECKLPCKLPS